MNSRMCRWIRRPKADPGEFEGDRPLNQYSAPGGSTFMCLLSGYYGISKLKRKLCLSITTFVRLP